ncbi:hypothetical protein ACET3Z_024630 [Daucus carota]
MRKICTAKLLNAHNVKSFRSIRQDETWQLSTIGEKCKYQDELVECVEEIAQLGSRFFMTDMFRSIKFLPLLTGMKRALDKIRPKVDGFFDYIIKEHEQKLSNRKKGSEVIAEDEDLIDVLLRIN